MRSLWRHLAVSQTPAIISNVGTMIAVIMVLISSLSRVDATCDALVVTAFVMIFFANAECRSLSLAQLKLDLMLDNTHLGIRKQAKLKFQI